VPREDIERQIAAIRQDSYEILRQLRPAPLALHEVQRHLADLEVETFRIEAEAPAAGRTLAELHIRGTLLQAGDLVITLGKPTQFAEAAPLFRS
jgi:hypothetical protein